jgi:hypothetical protein
MRRWRKIRWSLSIGSLLISMELEIEPIIGRPGEEPGRGLKHRS